MKIYNVRFGIDVGSTTVKVVVLDTKGVLIFSKYERHRADIRNTIIKVVSEGLDAVESKFGSGAVVSAVVTGSGGLAVSHWLNIPFVQEVSAATEAVRQLIPETDVVIELGGEDAKITYFENSNIEQRMNGTCAGGTGAFIDQMAALLETDAPGLNALARDAKTIYPIAARCGVFAKTDVQPLINEGARREDIAASIFQAVVSQTISGLACGKPIRGKIAFLGGPLHFLDQLRYRFIETLKLSDDEIIVPEKAELFVAFGAALQKLKVSEDDDKKLIFKKNNFLTVSNFRKSLESIATAEMTEIQRLEPLFKNEDELLEFRKRHAREVARTGDIFSAKGPVFLGLDAGSTTTKAVLIDTEGNILWRFYDINAGNPVQLAVKMLKDLYKILPADAHIARTVSTGYGELLFQSALGADAGEVETIAHYTAAEFFLPGVQFLLDIGGQDMKCLQMKDGAITSIQLNEACSAGCGSFLENFARSLGLSIGEFSNKALLAQKPVDLGSRCTVFMNSRVKQAQKEGASVGDISAGLSYSVIKNALFKVIKLRDAESIGEKIIVQGGTFNNDAVLRAFELISGRETVRPDVAGLMGAYGAGLIALNQWKEAGENPETVSNLFTLKDLENFEVIPEMGRCNKCSNNCLLTINTFSNGVISRKFITGNRCERGAETEIGKEKLKRVKLPNLFDWKYKRLFKYRPIPAEQAKRGVIGIPRVLNIYENYPFWHTFLTDLGFSVKLSPRSNRTVYEMGLESIPSESVCYPGKIVHGHIESLLRAGVKTIFYPCIPYEKQEDSGAGNHYNCPIVSSYPEVIKNNIEVFRQDNDIVYMNPFLPLFDSKALKKRLFEEFGERFNISKAEINSAVDKAWAEQERFQNDVHKKGEETLKEIEEKGLQAVVLAGRPYHLDPEVNHGIPELLSELNLAVLTEDSIAHLGEIERPLRIVDQWVYHNRLYRAAHAIADKDNIEMIQLTSFGCGLDAVTSDQVQEILEAKGKMHTLIKIDEGSNLGAIRIRVRSLIAASKARKNRQKFIKKRSSAYSSRKIFTKEMRKTYTILAPQMSPIHFELIEAAFRHSGYNFKILPNVDAKTIDVGLKYVNNDACYPAIIVVGQMIAALQSGDYDLDSVALAITQTGGGCRATNYIGFIRRALADAGFADIPVIGVSLQGIEKNPGFKLSPKFLDRALKALVLGDLLMRVTFRTRPYELIPGAVNKIHRKYVKRIREELKNMSKAQYNQVIDDIVTEFDTIPLRSVHKPRVGVVGEILVKFHPVANNNIFDVIENEGAECVVPDLMDFIFYSVFNTTVRYKYLGAKTSSYLGANFLISYLEGYRKEMKKALNNSKRFLAPESIYNLVKGVDGIVQTGNIMGEGWFLTAEMVELLHNNVSTIACIQPFACLPNHVTGKGMIKELRRRYPYANISAIDYDPGASEVNQLNRLKLLLANAKPGLHPNETKTGKTESSDEAKSEKTVEAHSGSERTA